MREALSRIARDDFDRLLSDLHMAPTGDGFTVVSAMPHTHPEAVTLVSKRLSALFGCCSRIGQSRGQTSYASSRSVWFDSRQSNSPNVGRTNVLPIISVILEVAFTQSSLLRSSKR